MWVRGVSGGAAVVPGPKVEECSRGDGVEVGGGRAEVLRCERYLNGVNGLMQGTL